MNSRWAKFSVKTKAKALVPFALMLMLFNSGSQAGQFLWPEDTDPTLVPYSGQVSRRAEAEIKSTRKAARPSRIAPPTSRPAPAVADESDDTSDDTKTAAKICVHCQNPKRSASALARVPGKKIAGLGAARDRGLGKLSAKELCYSNAIFEAAKARTKRAYRNRGRSHGACAVGVRLHLGAAGVYDGQPLGGAAIDYSSSGKMEKALGFQNRLSEFPTPESAPPGAVLIFAGPASHQYVTNRRKIYGPTGDAGNWAGHITVAGEKVGKNGRWYYTDGRTSQPAIGWPGNKTRRRLVGVMIMNQCGPGCSPALRNRCGG